MKNDDAFIATLLKKSAHGNYMEYQYLRAGNSTLTIKAPSYNGEYEVRLYKQSEQYDDNTFVMSVSFIVETN
jgi:hypothetical protein